MLAGTLATIAIAPSKSRVQPVPPPRTLDPFDAANSRISATIRSGRGIAANSASSLLRESPIAAASCRYGSR